jgi:tetratricopeptide (TPR) repeat protein
VLAHDPQNFIALANLSYAYKRRLDFKNALLLKQKCLMIDPGNGGVWKDLGDVFRLMGDYKNALKATIKATELSANQLNPVMAVYTCVIGNLPLDSLPDDVKTRARTDFDITTYALRGDWPQVTRIALAVKHPNWICTSYANRGMKDSVRYWGTQAIKKPKDPFYSRFQAFAGNREKALEVIENRFKADLETGVDKMSHCNRHVARVYAFAILGEYDEATLELKQLNADFPEFGDYGQFSAPWFQKTRREYPLFQEAVDNLKLRRSAELEQIIKF